MVTLKLNEAPLLSPFRHRQMKEEEVITLRRLLAQHLCKKLDIVVERAMHGKCITVEDIERASAEMKEHRGSYLKKV